MKKKQKKNNKKNQWKQSQENSLTHTGSFPTPLIRTIHYKLVTIGEPKSTNIKHHTCIVGLKC